MYNAEKYDQRPSVVVIPEQNKKKSKHIRVRLPTPESLLLRQSPFPSQY